LGVSGSVGSSFAFRFSAFLTKIQIKQRHFSQTDRKDALTRGTKNLRIEKHQEHLLCVKHWFKELDDPQAAAGPSQAFADTRFPFFRLFDCKIKIKQRHFSQKLST
jgi:hypothetical protein